ncbi:MAG: hypothetical protein KDI79_25475 [Anaerolineae bacterium]|nr:hypothetical protein [Anaerolineae bacterium]
MTKTITGLYDDIAQARAAVEDLVDHGFSREDISLVAADPTEEYGRQLGPYDDTIADDAADATAGAATGAVAGGVLGGLGGVLLGLGALAIPGVGPIIAAGPIAAGLVGAGVGAAAGGLVGAMIGWGIPEQDARYYTEGIRRGGTFVAVRAADHQVGKISSILNDHNPVNIEERVEMWRNEGWTGYDPDAQPYTPAEIEAERERYY